jgi:hypothetical protein
MYVCTYVCKMAKAYKGLGEVGTDYFGYHNALAIKKFKIPCIWRAHYEVESVVCEW